MIIFDHGDNIVHMGKTIAQKRAHVVKDGIRRKTAVGCWGYHQSLFFEHLLLQDFALNFAAFDRAFDEASNDHVCFSGFWEMSKSMNTAESGRMLFTVVLI